MSHHLTDGQVRAGIALGLERLATSSVCTASLLTATYSRTVLNLRVYCKLMVVVAHVVTVAVAQVDLRILISILFWERGLL